MGLKVAQAIAATGASDSLVIKEGFLSISGTFVGTVAVQVDPAGDGTWLPLLDADGAAYEFTAAATMAIDNGAAIKTRVYFTRSSGTVNVVLDGDVL